MNDEIRNTITYDEGWKNVTEIEYPQVVEYEDDLSKNPETKKELKKKKEINGQLLISIQLILCIIIAISAFVFKSIGGDLYEKTRNWYYTQINNSAIFDNKNVLDLTKFSDSSTSDEIQNIKN